MSRQVTFLLLLALGNVALYGLVTLPIYLSSKGEATRLQAEIDRKSEELASREKELADGNARLLRLQSLEENRETEIRQLDKLLRAREQEVNDLLVKSKPLREEYEAVLKAYEKQKQGVLRRQIVNPDGITKLPNPPAEGMYGRIKAVDEKSGLLEINLGSDSGLAKDHTLLVYRVGTDCTYLGILRIDDVRPDSAAGKLFIGHGLGGKIQVGDEVTSELPGASK